MLKRSPNRAYLASRLRHFAQIQPYGWTSNTFSRYTKFGAKNLLKIGHLLDQ